MIDSRLALQPAQHSGAPMVAIRPHARQIDFPVRVLGQSDAAIVPQRVGNWWMEPLSKETELPPRARQRLQSFLTTGVTPKAIVVFHEIPTAPHEPSRSARIATRLHRFANQELPPIVQGVQERVQQTAPVVGRGVLRVASAALPVIGIAGVVLVGAMGLLAASALSVLAAAVTDPCLVVVTEDGQWIEIDRWYS